MTRVSLNSAYHSVASSAVGTRSSRHGGSGAKRRIVAAGEFEQVGGGEFNI
ncbi:hypothetical protein RA11412_2168 [Rothia aeria]|uniref:Uncharacterized protein n=1 Tax=Rothia aeria TaxID=172042 RepID=A0A2Z5R145_9MICC|nr:hypothetical protein RA11412_2168 [Rothia aeria]